MMKLGWELITNKEALWVKVIQGKYNFGGLLFPTVKCGSKASHIWRGMTKVWSLVEQSISWVVRDGYNVRFWQECQVPGIGPLHEHFTEISEVDWNLPIAAYTSANGWRWEILENILPRHICNKIVSVNYPKPGHDDFPIWSHTSYGFFSIKYAYQFLYKDINHDPPEFPL